MKLNYLVLGVTAILSLSSVQGVMVQPPARAVEMTALKSGTFVAAEHPTFGGARIVSENGKRYLELDRAFKSDKGPDLHVILHRNATLPIGGLKAQDYVILSRLQKVSGSQRYAIPNNVKLADFRSVAIWCRMFNATFGYAPLTNGGAVANQPSVRTASTTPMTVASVKSGMFVAAEHPTFGGARIVSENGKRYLELDRAFKSDKGPDLHVILHRDAALPKGGLKEQDYVIIGRLEKVSGTQRYAIPEDVMLANYSSVAIWCRMFNATFGYAPLKSNAQASL